MAGINFTNLCTGFVYTERMFSVQTLAPMPQDAHFIRDKARTGMASLTKKVSHSIWLTLNNTC